MDIVITIYDFRNLVDNVITDPTHTNLMQHALVTIAHLAIGVVQNKT
jgi:hypothetical protein